MSEEIGTKELNVDCSMAYVELELLCKVMGEGSRIRSNIRMSQSTAISPLDRAVGTSFACPQLGTLVSLTSAQLL